MLGGAFELGLGQVFEGAYYALSITISCSSICDKFKKSVDALKPIMDKICDLSEESMLQDFKEKLDDALLLVEECKKTSFFNLRRRFSYVKRLQAVDEEINSFLRSQIPLISLFNDLKSRDNVASQLRDDMDNIASQMARDANDFPLLRQQIFEIPAVGREDKQKAGFSGPQMPSNVFGINESLIALKGLLLDTDINVVGVTGMSGVGKSTLASALCHDREIKDYFGNRVIYITVSKDPSLQEILETMWEKIVGGTKPHFQNVEDAHHRLQEEIRARNNPRTLVVLDDIWSKPKLKRLLFDGEGYKTIVTTRDANIIPKGNGTRLFLLPCLQEEHAHSLFCLSAFGQSITPSTYDKELVKQIQAECKGLPLALKVIGSSLREQPSFVWESAKKKLARGETISDDHKEDLLERLKTSIDALDDIEKQCFLDLGAFPEGRKICANALLDIWVYVRGMDWEHAFVLLWEFAGRNLLELKGDPWSLRISYGCTYELSFSQHDVMRDLALHMAKHDKMRLCMPQKHYGFLSNLNRDQPSKAQIVSIHTGAMDEKQWLEMEFPEAEALVLFFTASEYYIPPFLHTMQRLKVLIIHNYSSQRAKLNGLDAFLPLSQLKTLQLERLIVRPLYKYWRSLISLEKLSLSLCEGLGNMGGLGRDKCFKFPKILEINLDHCSDLEELPMGICNLNSLEKLSVTNCHLLHKLPDDLGELSLLQVLRLCACPSFTTLPTSICKLKQLQFLDISQCGCLKGLPSEFGGLSSLKKLDMRECSKLKLIPQTLTKLARLKHVVCDKNNEQQLMSFCKTSSMSELTVEVVEEPFSLDWLDY